MTAIETTDFPQPPSGALSTFGRITRLAVPLMIGSLAAAGLHVVKAGILTHNGMDQALYTLSMVQPGFILMLAFLESLAITNQVFSSKSVSNWAKGDVLRATRVFSIIGLVVTAILGLAFWGASRVVGNSWAEGREILPQMSLFVLSLAPYLLFEMRNGALRGQGKTARALIPFVVLIIGDLVATWIAVTQFGFGFKAVLIGNMVGPLLALPMVTVMLRREIGDAERGPNNEFKKHVIGLSIGVAGPVFASMFAGSASAAVIFPSLAALGQEVASGFLVIVRIRIMFIIPAVAVGSAIAILINQLPEKGFVDEKRTTLRSGVTGVLMIYALATAAVYALRVPIVDMVVPATENPALFQQTVDLMVLLIVTFFLIGAFTMLQVILEHLGLGVRVLMVTVVTEVATIGLVFLALAQGHGLDGLIWVMNGIAALTFVILGAVFVGFTRKMEVK